MKLVSRAKYLSVPLMCVGLAVLMLSCSAPSQGSSETANKVRSNDRKIGHEGMVLIPGGKFKMGSDSARPDEAPPHEVELSAFWMDETEVTNRQFQKFVQETGYVTEAEKAPKPEDFPGVPQEKLVPGALVFQEGKGWKYEPGANWRHPLGPESKIDKVMDHPVVQVCWDDAIAYAKWAGKSLPTEAQYEYAARGGDVKAIYAWGSDSPSDTKPQTNYWQGQFPEKNANTDGFRNTSPVRHYAANKYGLYDIAGNVWEWCSDLYAPDSYKSTTKLNPTGATISYDPDEPGVEKRVVRGGSFLCAECYCSGYRLTARMKSSPDTGLMHTGFRCVINARKE